MLYKITGCAIRWRCGGVFYGSRRELLFKSKKDSDMLKKLFGLALALLATLAVSAQVRVGEGQLSGSFESNSIYYQDDSGLGAAGTAPDDRFGSNNYMKLAT